ncbi:uncharacterized protein ACRADG_012023 [Cochliomyia hominivorax]
MCSSKMINKTDYQNCGEIMVAVKKNKFAMSCKFCPELFTQLQTFMRHLQLLHNNELEFVKQAKEVEVYAVEELMNQTIASSAPDIESEESNFAEEDTKWLNEQDMNWLQNGVEPKRDEKLPNQDGKNDEMQADQGLSLANMSILKALEDCDVSFNLMDDFNSTKCGENKEDETNLNSTILREIENDWYDSDSNDSQPKTIDCSQVFNLSKQILDLTTELELDATMSEIPVNSTCMEDNLESDENDIETTNKNGIKGLLEGLEDMDNIDELLENLESDSEFRIKTKSTIDIKEKEEKLTKENVILNKNPNIRPLNQETDFERRLKQLENDLENDTEPISYIELIKAKEFCKIVNDLEDFVKDYPQENKVRKNNEYKTKSKDFNEKMENLNISNDSKLQLQNLEDSLDFEEIEQNKTSKALSEDLTKALADALNDENYDLLHLPAEEKNEMLSSDLLSLLDQELMDTENESNTLETDSEIVNITENVTDIKNLSKCKKQRNPQNVENNIKLKYQKTNLKAKTKLIETQTKNILKPSNKSLIFKESNTQNSINILNAQQLPLKGNHQIYKQQKYVSSLNNSLKSPAKKPAIETINRQLLSNSLHRKTPNKENRENKTPNLNIRNIKQEKITPSTIFVNTDRRDKTPLKQENLFIKQSPKTQEKEENLRDNETPKRGNKTPQERTIKQSPRTQEKQQNINNQQTPKIARQKTPQFRATKSVKQSPKTQEKLQSPENSRNKSPKTPETTCKEQLKISPKKSTQTFNEKLNNNSNSSPTQQTAINSNLSNFMGDTRTPLATPQRLKNVAIKLQKITPDKLCKKHQKFENNTMQRLPKPMEDETNEFLEQFKLPKGISLSKIPKQNSDQDVNQSEIIETPVKATFCKQNFNESSLDPIDSQEIKTGSSNDASSTCLLPLQNHVIDSLKTEASNSKLRQRKASIDIVNNPEQHISKTPRHSNLDYKSYAVSRSARKKEVLQRMRHIKKQIFKSIEGGEFITRFKQVKSPLMKSQKKRKIFIENVQILPKLQQETLTPLINSFNDFKKSLVNNTPAAASQTVSPKNLPDDQKQANKILDGSKIDSPINDDEKLVKKSLKRPATSPLLNEEKQAKRLQKSPAKDQQISSEKPLEMETTQLDLSESVVDFLQRDLKANRLNVDSFLNAELPVDNCIPDETSLESNAKDTKLEEKSMESESKNSSNLINDLLNQMENEQISNEKTQTEASSKNEGLNNEDIVEDFDENRDLQLLAKFGLKIVKFPDIEDSICLEERDKMNEKALKFSKIYINYPRVWSSRNSEVSTFKEELDISFKQLQHETNIFFNVDLCLEEIKRLTNLINIWYSHNCNNKLIEKRKINEATNRYLLIFHYMPKTTKRFFYCEYCEEYFNTEHKYFTHRIIHTGALYPYKCRNCPTGFKNFKQLKNHEAICDVNSDSKSIDKLKPNTYERSKQSFHKCMMCAEIFEASEDLYEHSKKHLKTIYNCVKCELVFASAIDVQNHMTICNPVAKRLPKQYTPRPQKTKSEPLSKNFI